SSRPPQDAWSNGVRNTRQLDKFVVGGKSYRLPPCVPSERIRLVPTGLDCEVEPGTVSTRLAATDDPSKHESLYVEIVLVSTECLAKKACPTRPKSGLTIPTFFPFLPPHR